MPIPSATGGSKRGVVQILGRCSVLRTGAPLMRRIFSRRERFEAVLDRRTLGLILQITEIAEELPRNVIDLRTGKLISEPLFSPPPEPEVIFVRSSCAVCGKPFWWCRLVGKPGRSRRVCPAETCRLTRHRQHVRKWRHDRRVAGMADLFA